MKMNEELVAIAEEMLDEVTGGYGCSPCHSGHKNWDCRPCDPKPRCGDAFRGWPFEGSWKWC